MKSLFKNSIYNFAYKLFTMLFPLITSTYVARILLADGVGKVALAQNYVSYFTVVAGLGMSTYGVREIGKVQRDLEERNRVFWQLLIINAVSTLVCASVYYGMVLFVPFFSEEQTLYIFAGLVLLLNAFNVDWFYQGVEEYGYITLRSLAIKILSVILIFVLVKQKEDYALYTLITCIGTAGNNILNLFHLRKYISKPEFPIKKSAFVRHLQPLFILLSTNIAVELYTKVDTTMLGALSTKAVVGYYSYATKLTNMVVSAVATVSVILLPRLSYYIKNNKKSEFNKIVSVSYKTLLTISIPCCLGINMIADEAVAVLFGDEFLPAATTVKILSVLVVVKAIGNLFGTQVLLTVGLEKKLFYTTVIGAIVNIALNSVLIPTYQNNGAAIASVVSEIVVMMVQMFYARKYVSYALEKGFCISVIMPAIIMLIAGRCCTLFNMSAIAELVLKVAVCSGVYTMGTLLLRNESAITIVRKLTKR